mgnify:FL=1
MDDLHPGNPKNHSPMRAHPVAELFPLLVGQELQSLADDIRAHGLLHPIVTHNGLILDGRNRATACAMAGVTMRTEPWCGQHGSPVRYVVAANIQRRHLTAADKATLGEELLPHLEEEAKERMAEGGRGGKIATPSRAREVVASMVGVSARYISDVKRLKAKAPKVYKRLKQNRLTIPEAMREAGLIHKSAPVLSSESVEWYTPAELIEAARGFLGAP